MPTAKLRAVSRRAQDAQTNRLSRPKRKIQIITRPVKEGLGSPTALGIGAFSVTLTTLSLSLMGWRNVTVDNVFIGNFLFVAGIGMIISAQWELVHGDSFAYTAISAFGFFYGGYGAILTPLFGVHASYGDDVAQYNNALGFFMITYFATADGNISTGLVCRKAGGVFGFLGGICGWYAMFHLMAQRTFFYKFPLGDTSGIFKKSYPVMGSAA
ncbi:hypothetical protein BP6252_11025 [Coleophoma cylindrospora]|uniref:Uncharacterized protein n=1 Tax=Coleophoma cylindrospora TaxID=1849047 RepID=A0A3D8QPB5_9HELO|nr:hypothetical protein BP6252_11025 [Coleophoma cylindrospora]